MKIMTNIKESKKKMKANYMLILQLQSIDLITEI